MVRSRIEWKEEAKAELRAIDRVNAMHILHGIDRLAAFREGDVKRLQNIEPPEYRLRVGNYRVRFYDWEDTLFILSVRHRSKAYKD